MGHTATQNHQIRPYSPGKHFAPLDGLRGIAILLVILLHFSFGPGTTLFDHLLFRIDRLGNTGVDLFFVLSGFLITGILIDAKGGANYFSSFYMRRTLRIFPLYYVYLFVMLILLPYIRGAFHGLIHASAPVVQHQAWFWLYASNTAPLVYGPFPTPGLAQLWSLAVEEQFYLIWPLIVILCSGRLLARICVGMLIVAPAVRMLCMHFGHDDSAFRLMPARMDSLAMGALLALAIRNVKWMTLFKRFRRPVMMVSALIVVLLVAFRGRWDEADPWTTTLGISTIGIFYTALLTEVLSVRQGPLASVTSWSVLRTIGKYSYGIYVLHGITEHLVGPSLERALHLPTIAGSPILNQLATYIILGIASFLFAVLSWNLLERWFLLFKDKFQYRKTKSAPQSSSA